jgi:hypothetical protein
MFEYDNKKPIDLDLPDDSDENNDDIQDQDVVLDMEVVDVDVDVDVDVVDSDTDNKTDDTQSKHKIKGKHSLPRDTIFKGKVKKGENSEDDENSADFLVPKQDNFDFDVSSGYHEETKDPEEYTRLKQLKEEIYLIIVDKTDINIKNSRRKPGRLDFNKYYAILVDNLDTSTYSYGEIFIELSFYFSDNIFNMFKLLDKKWGGKIIKELAKKRNIKIDQMDFL